MRGFFVLAVCGLLGGCSFLDQLAVGGPPRLDPNKIYLGAARVRNLHVTELDKYACVNEPLVCTQGGALFDCSCPR